MIGSFPRDRGLRAREVRKNRAHYVSRKATAPFSGYEATACGEAVKKFYGRCGGWARSKETLGGRSAREGATCPGPELHHRAEQLDHGNVVGVRRRIVIGYVVVFLRRLQNQRDILAPRVV